MSEKPIIPIYPSGIHDPAPGGRLAPVKAEIKFDYKDQLFLDLFNAEVEKDRVSTRVKVDLVWIFNIGWILRNWIRWFGKYGVFILDPDHIKFIGADNFITSHPAFKRLSPQALVFKGYWFKSVFYWEDLGFGEIYFP